MGKEEHTNEHFITINNERIYRTADRGIIRDDNDFIYRGRCDRQVQLRGYRIELGEIETAAQTISECHALATIEKKKNLDYLILYIQSEELSITDFKQKLQALLPSYMCPSHIYIVSSIPLTVNGKVDLEKLKEMRTQALPSPTFSSNPLEMPIADTWKEVLGIETIAHDVNFFEAGGHSLALIEVCNQLKNQGFEVDITDLFEYSTVETLAQFLTTQQLESL